LDDPFFDSLKAAYREFPAWFERKADQNVYVVDNGVELSGMIYLKREVGPVVDVEPPLPDRVWLKVGTLKIVSRGTKLGERVIKKIFDTAIAERAEGIYVTVFDVHQELINLFERYGFRQEARKTTSNGVEQVLVRSLTDLTGDPLLDYPFIHAAGRDGWLLAIYPEYHTRLLPDSILRNEPLEIVRDVSPTNTIHKVYIARMPLTRMSPGDIVLFYRTSDGLAPAHYRSVVTSACVVEEVRQKRDFASLDDFLAYTNPRSVFTEDERREYFAAWKRLYVARMTYNAAFQRRITRGQLLEEGVVSEQPRWDLRRLNEAQLRYIMEIGGVDARLVVD
jgi:hypothetical protein